MPSCSCAPERGRIADRRQGERPRELERVARVARVPIGQADLPADGARLVASGNRLDQRQRHRHRRRDAGRRRHAVIDHQPAVFDIAHRRMLLAQFLDGIPVRGRPLAMQQPGVADHLGADADADDDRLLGRLAPDPLQRRGIIVAGHGGNDDIVGAIGMLRIELCDCRLRLDLERRKQRHGAGRRCQRHDVGDVGAREDAVGHQVIGGLGRVVDADDGDQRALPLRRPQGRDRCIALVLRDRRRGCDGRRRRQRENPAAADGNQKCDNANGAPQQHVAISWLPDSMLP